MDEKVARRAHSLFMKAIELDPEDRARYLRSACAGDLDLERRIGDLLSALDRAPTFLETPALGNRPTATQPPTSIPRTIGEYHIERMIGAGGMATVYEAIQDQPKRRVALKVMRHGLMHTSAVHRFQFETEVLAKLQHPGIAQIFEVGAYDAGHGVTAPFFAMEFIDDATPINSFAERRGLSLSERMELFTSVCDAVQHGHQLGVIHRDLKPGNILVDAQGRPKVIDFGVARSADPQQAWITRHTDFGQLIGTLHYMSPEQCAGDNRISIRTDVYSLGVVLYELLCGRLPHDLSQTPLPDALQIIRQRTTPPPSAHDPRLRGDIDAIVMMAIDKEPDRRYPTAEALAADIRRYIRHETIDARSPTMVYRCRLFVRRHRALVAAAASVLLAIVGGGVMSARFAYQAYQEAERRQIAENHAIQERDAARWQAYVANIGGAFAALQTNEFQQMRTRLAAASPKLRGWEWYFLSGLADRSRQTITAHDDMVYAFAVSRDGSQLATGSRDGALRVWRVTDGLCTTTFEATPGSAIYSVSFSPDGTQIVAGSQDHSVRIWDISSGTQSCLLGLHSEPVQGVSWGHQGKIASADQEGDLQFWAADFCASYGTTAAQPEKVHGVLYSEDGAYLLTWNEAGAVRLFADDGADACRTWSFGERVQCAAVSRDNTRVAVGGPNGHIAVWNIEENHEILNFSIPGHVSTVRSLAFSNDGDQLAVGLINRNIVVLSVQEGGIVHELRGHSEAVSGLWFTPDDRSIVSASWDRTVRFWGIHPSTTTGIVSTLKGHEDHLLATAFSPDGAIVASAGRDDIVRLWDPDLGTSLGFLRGHSDDVYGLAFSPDGNLLASASSDRSVRIWDTRTGKQLQSLEHSGSVWGVVFSPDGRRLATGGGDTLIRIWDTVNFDLIGTFSGHTARVNQLAISPDGRLLASASRDQSVRLWSMESGEQLHLFSGHNSDVFAVTFSLDGRRLFSGSRDQSVRVWDTSTGAMLKVLSGHGQLITSLSVSPDGARLAAGSWFGEIVFWDLGSYDFIASFKGHELAIRSLTFDGRGRWLASASHDGTLRLFEAGLPGDRIALHQRAQQKQEEARAVLERMRGKKILSTDISISAGSDDAANSELMAWVRKLMLAESLDQSFIR